MPFKETGFLGDEINEFVKGNIENNKLLEISYDINRFLNMNLENLMIHDITNKDLFIVGLTVKSLQSFDSVLILTKHGLEADAEVLLRVLLEGVIYIGAIVNDRDYFLEYLKKSDAQVLTIVNNMKREKYSKFFNEDTIDKIKSEDYRELVEVVSSKDGKYKKLSAIAEKAEMLDLYLYVYGILSNYVHVNAKIIKGYSDFKEGKFVGFNNVPSTHDQVFILVTLNNIMIKLLKLLEKRYCLGFGPSIDTFANRLSKWLK